MMQKLRKEVDSDSEATFPSLSLSLRSYVTLTVCWLIFFLLLLVYCSAIPFADVRYTTALLCMVGLLLGGMQGIAGFFAAALFLFGRRVIWSSDVSPAIFTPTDWLILFALLVGAWIGRARWLRLRLLAERDDHLEAKRRLANSLTPPTERDVNQKRFESENEKLRAKLERAERLAETLKRREEQFREIFENASDAVYIHDLEPGGHLLYVNREACRLTGYRDDELKGMPIEQLIAPESLESSRAYVLEQIKSTIARRYEIVMLTKTGERITLEVNTRPIREGDRAIAIQGIARDVSDRKDSERTQLADLRELRALNRVADETERTRDFGKLMAAICETMRDIFDTDRAYLNYPLDPNANSYTTPYFAAIPEYAVDQSELPTLMLDREAKEFLVDLLESRMPVAIEPGNPLLGSRFLRSYRVRSMLMLAIHPRVGLAWSLGLTQCRSDRIWNSDERRLFQKIGMRVSEALTNVLLYRELRDSEKKFRDMIENLHDGIFRCDTEGRLLEANPALAAILGYPDKTALLGTKPFPNASEGDLESLLLEAGATELDLRRFDGESVHVELRSRAVIDQTGEIVGYEGSIRDLTERRQAEKDQSSLRERIQESERMESLGLLAGGIAHDFNNLLMGMLGNAGLAMQEVGENDTLRELIGRLETSALRAADLTNQLLAYSGKGKFLIQSIDLSSLVAEILRLLKGSLSRRIEFQTDFDEHLPAVEADGTQLRQLVMNLITNAADAIGEEPGTIKLQTQTLEFEAAIQTSLPAQDPLPAGRYVTLDVTDSGEGITSETVRRIFDPFFTTKPKGRGLGLSAAIGIVRGHHGAIEVHSEPSVGTTFRIYLPVSDRPVQTKSVAPALPVVTRERVGCVLVVDDESTVRDVACSVLKKSGYTVAEAGDGIEAIEVLAGRQEDFVAVLLDITMPRMSGIEAVPRLLEIQPNVPIVLSSGYSQESMASASKLGPMIRGFIQKPYRPSELVKLIEEIAERSPLAELANQDVIPDY